MTSRTSNDNDFKVTNLLAETKTEYFFPVSVETKNAVFSGNDGYCCTHYLQCKVQKRTCSNRTPSKLPLPTPLPPLHLPPADRTTRV